MFEDEKENQNENSNPQEGEEYESFNTYNDEESINISSTYAGHMLQKKRLERKMRKGNIWTARLHVLLRLIILTSIIYLLYNLVKAPQWYVDKDIFTSSSPNLEIINNNIVPTYKILNELRKITVINEPIYKFETDKIRINLLELEPIEDVYIRRFWFPARLQIMVKERTPLISVYTQENSAETAFFTEDGVLIGQDYLPLPAEYKTIKVIAPNTYRNWDKAKIEKITKLVQYIENISNEKVTFLDLRKQNDVFVQMPTVTLRIGAIDDAATERVSRITSILPALKQVKESIQYVDLRWKDATYIKKGNSKIFLDAQPNPSEQTQTNQNKTEQEAPQNIEEHEDLTEDIDG